MKFNYELIYDFDNLYRAYLASRRSKRSTREVIQFEMNVGPNLCQLQQKLRDGSYQLSGYYHFTIHDPKVREIYALHYRDRILQHSLCDNVLAPYFETHLIYAETKPVFDKYSRMFFKPLKDGFAKEHETELTDHKRAYGYLMKNHGGKLEVTPSEFDAELHRMKQEDAAATADLESIKGQLTEMKKLKRKLEKSTPELAREDRSVREQLTRTPERTPERNTPRKPTTQKKHDQTR